VCISGTTLIVVVVEVEMQALMSERDVMAKVLIVVQPFAALVEVEDVAFACAGGTQLSLLGESFQRLLFRGEGGVALAEPFVVKVGRLMAVEIFWEQLLDPPLVRLGRRVARLPHRLNQLVVLAIRLVSLELVGGGKLDLGGLGIEQVLAGMDFLRMKNQCQSSLFADASGR